MKRLDLRCDVRIPVTLIPTTNPTPQETFTRDVGLSGAFVYTSEPIPEGIWTKIIMKLPEGPIEAKGRVLRQSYDGVALKFRQIDEDGKVKLWKTIVRYIEPTVCPFCGSSISSFSDYCSSCGLFINLRSDRFWEVYDSFLFDEKKKQLEKAITRFKLSMEELEEAINSDEVDYDELYKKFNTHVEDLISTCRDVEETIGHRKNLLKNLKSYFKEATEEIFSKGTLVKHARIWPRGYPGDYRMLEYIYLNTPLSTGLGRLLDMGFLRTTLATAVRERLKTLVRLLRECLKNRVSPSLLNIGCGSCRELVELLPEIKQSKARIVCTDFDEEALDFSAKRMSYTEIAEQVHFRKYNALRMIDKRRNLREFGLQDIIYSTGLFDYLTDDILVKLFSSLYDLLKPNGKLIVSFKDANRYTTEVYHWIANWDAFFQRTTYDIEKILEEATMPNALIESLREPSGVIIFYVITKPS